MLECSALEPQRTGQPVWDRADSDHEGTCGVMSAIRPSLLLRGRRGTPPDIEGLSRDETGDAPRLDRLGARDHRDDGPAIATIFCGLAVSLPIWVLLFLLLAVLL